MEIKLGAALNAQIRQIEGLKFVPPDFSLVALNLPIFKADGPASLDLSRARTGLKILDLDPLVPEPAAQREVPSTRIPSPGRKAPPSVNCREPCRSGLAQVPSTCNSKSTFPLLSWTVPGKTAETSPFSSA